MINLPNPTPLKQQGKLWCGIAMSALLLAGCNTMPQRTASETFKNSVSKYSNDKSFNFTIEQQMRLKAIDPSSKSYTPKISIEDAGYKPLTKSDDANAKVAKAKKTMQDCDDELDAAFSKNTDIDKAEKAYLACLKAATDDSSAGKKGKKSKKGKSKLDKLDGISKAMTPERIAAIDTYLLKPLTSKLIGAVDTQSKQVQIDYTVDYRPKNFTLSMTFPMLLDFQEMSITLDPSIALPVLGPVFSEEIGTKWEGKGVKFTLPAEFKDEVPVDVILRALPKAITSSYGAMPDDMFSYVQADDMAKSIHASRVVNMKMTPKQQITLLDSFLTNWVNAVDEEAKKTPDAVKDLKTFNDFLEMAKAATKDGLLSTPKMQNMLEEAGALDMMGSYDSKYYFDRNGRMLGAFSLQKMDFLTDILNADVIGTNKILISNTNNAVFTFRPTGSDVIDGNALIEEFGLLGKKKKKKAAAEKARDAADDAASAVTEGATTITVEAACDGEAMIKEGVEVVEDCEVVIDDSAIANSGSARAVIEAADKAIAVAEAAEIAALEAEAEALAITPEDKAAIAAAEAKQAAAEKAVTTHESEADTIRVFCENADKKTQASALCQQNF